MKIISRLIYFACVSLASLTMASCSDVDDEITEIVFGRNFSPTNLGASVRNRTNVYLTWDLRDSDTGYEIEVYEDDSLTFAGSPVQTISISKDDVPYTVTGLIGETAYSFRVRAITENDESRTSKWSGVYAKTGAEQIATGYSAEARSVTLTWKAGESADFIQIGSITHNLTASEIAEGSAKIDGLTPNTEYEAVMKRGDKTRASWTFTTDFDLGDAHRVHEGDDLAAIVAAAADGDSIAVFEGTYVIEGETGVGSLAIDKSLKFFAATSNDHPVINARFSISNNASLEIVNISLTGKNTDGGQAFTFEEDGNYDHLTLTGCSISDYTKGFYYLAVSANQIVNDVTIYNCIVSDIECNGGDFFDARSGQVKKLTVTNSTFDNNCKEREFVRDNKKNGAEVKIDHCTFYNCLSSKSDSKFFFNVQSSDGSIAFTNNLIVGMGQTWGKWNKTVPSFKGNNYFDSPQLQTATQTMGLSKYYDDSATTVDPAFKDAENGDFTITSDLKFTGVGAPRWCTE